MNRIRCNLCDVTITSRHRHDFQYCGCRSCAVDGGSDYRRRLGTGNFEELSVYEDHDGILHGLCDKLGAELAIKDKVLLNIDGESVLLSIESFVEGGIAREDTHRVGIVGYGFYVRPSDLTKVEVLN